MVDIVLLYCYSICLYIDVPSKFVYMRSSVELAEFSMCDNVYLH